MTRGAGGQGPLAGVRVLELGQFITAPYAAQLLADLGADVIKIERPGAGDPSRAWGQGDYSPWFIAHNRSKRGLALDLANPIAGEVADRLVASADVLIENHRPGVAERLGIGWDRARALNPRLIYCSVTGFRRDGRDAARPSFDSVAQAMSGLMGLLIDAERPRPVGPPLADTVTGLLAAQAVLAALVARERTGVGQRVETTMLEASMSLLLEPITLYLQTGARTGARDRAQVAQSYAFRCADDRLLVVHLSSPEKFWTSLARCLGRGDLLERAEFADRGLRISNYDRVHAELAPDFAARPREHWLTALTAADVPHAPIHAIDEVLDDPDLGELGLVQELEHPVRGSVRCLRSPLQFSGTPLPAATAPPTLGEDTDDILAALGFDEAERARLRDAKVV